MVRSCGGDCCVIVDGDGGKRMDAGGVSYVGNRQRGCL